MLLGVLGVLAGLFLPGVGPAPVEGIEVTKPLWLFWWWLTLESQKLCDLREPTRVALDPRGYSRVMPIRLSPSGTR